MSNDRDPKQVDRRFDRLSANERAVVGSPGDYDWDGATTSPARPRPDMTQFSLRLERELYDALQVAADRENLRVSDIARAALRSFLYGGSTTARPDLVVSSGNIRMMVQVKGQSAQFPATRRFHTEDERGNAADERPTTIVGEGRTLAP